MAPMLSIGAILYHSPSPQPSPVKGEGVLSLLPWREKVRMRGKGA